MDTPDLASFPNLLRHLGALRSADTQEVKAGHRNMQPGLWLSSAPIGRGLLRCAPGKDHFKLTLQEADTGRWAALGLALPIEKLREARYFGLVIKGGAAQPLVLTPTVRFHIEDAPAEDLQANPVILSGAPRVHLAHVALPPALAKRANGAECNLFFQSSQGRADIHLLEPVLMN